MKIFSRPALAGFATAALAAMALASLVGSSAEARTALQITQQGKDTLRLLEAQDPRARGLSRRARAVLVFPSIIKGGFIFGAQSGNGVLLAHGKTRGYYNLSGGSWGLQAGAQDFSYVLFLMNDRALSNVESNSGFSAGTGPSVVVINKSAQTAVDTSMIDHDVYAFPFNGKGLMADLTLQGTKISQIHPK
ncbi:lipid-binding SYLF domain-containing protein [Novosphingobium humi]|uniref:Lipid-binding SYLF domain-containing protein n=1 Tax=Novosphingobium humi TaxID=2282397 RepID=A0ABY7U6S9_9SPHN|nr:lipid-binding SYLF domain-containing protein [Novosphingobium humi]WCT80039.1 lipid-binding SYLF domain-containing protein [Novosphingobium humi]